MQLSYHNTIINKWEQNY